MSSSVIKLKQYSENNKVIGIKPIQVSANTSTETEEFDEQEQIQIRLQNAHSQLKRVEQQSKEILESAHKQIELDRNQWKEEKNDLIHQAKEQGYSDGFELGKKESLEEYSKLIDQAQAIIKKGHSDYDSIIEKSEDTVLELALNVASKILHFELVETDHFINIVKHVIKETKGQSTVSIYSHPEDYILIDSHKEELINNTSSQTLSIYPDADLERGSCIIETSFGKIDASVDSQLIELSNKLIGFAQEVGREHSRIP
ncbi:flagellar assembly protein FliH [Aquibacillus halophilus]|uniref:flagellar assembly protein FliH n=1 Tax=Aquibacillus halophilus TaxID=930132 RepID=UPI001479419B